MVWEPFSNDPIMDIYPNMTYLLYLLNMFDIMSARVERLLLKIKLIKTCLRRKLGQLKLDQLLCIGTNSLKNGFDDVIYGYFVDKMKKTEHKNQT